VRLRTCHITIAEQPDARASLPALSDDVSMARAVQDAHRHIPAQQRKIFSGGGNIHALHLHHQMHPQHIPEPHLMKMLECIQHDYIS
jgi:hypothetical protein